MTRLPINQINDLTGRLMWLHEFPNVAADGEDFWQRVLVARVLKWRIDRAIAPELAARDKAMGRRARCADDANHLYAVPACLIAEAEKIAVPAQTYDPWRAK